MKDVQKTIGNLIDRQGTAFIGSVSAEGFPNVKAVSYTHLTLPTT